MGSSRVLAALALSGLVVAACGDDDGGTSSEASGERTIEIEMVDIAYEPGSVEVEQGETVRFVFTNSGEIAHDAFLGDEAAQDEHEMEMREAEEGDAGHGHDTGGDMADEEAVTVEPGETGELLHTFAESGEVLIGCHQPGHYEAGMIVEVAVS